MKIPKKIIYPALLAWGIFTATVFHVIQPPNNFSVNDKADANEYLKIYEYFHDQTGWENVRFGIHNRMLVPYLAALIPGEDVQLHFFIVNTIFALLSLLAIFYLMNFLEIKPTYIFIALVFFSLHFVGPFRQNAIGPINVDIPVYLFEILPVLWFIRKKYLPLVLLAPVAVATKELFIAYYVILFIVAAGSLLALKDKEYSLVWVAAALLLAILTKILLNHYFPSATPSRNSLIVVAFHLREMLHHPEHLWMWLLSIFAAFGGFIFLIAKKHWKFEIRNRNHLIIHMLTVASLALSIVGGMDYTRLVFIGFPYIISSVFLLSKPQVNEVWVAGIMSILLSRFWIVLPVISLDLSPYRWWMPENSDINSLFGWTIAIIVGYFLYIILRKLTSYFSVFKPRT
jgi:hypothetical protein